MKIAAILMMLAGLGLLSSEDGLDGARVYSPATVLYLNEARRYLETIKSTGVQSAVRTRFIEVRKATESSGLQLDEELASLYVSSNDMDLREIIFGTISRRPDGLRALIETMRHLPPDFDPELYAVFISDYGSLNRARLQIGMLSLLDQWPNEGFETFLSQAIENSPKSFIPACRYAEALGLSADKVRALHTSLLNQVSAPSLQWSASQALWKYQRSSENATLIITHLKALLQDPKFPDVLKSIMLMDASNMGLLAPGVASDTKLIQAVLDGSQPLPIASVQQE